jgi:hypothetical protein
VDGHRGQHVDDDVCQPAARHAEPDDAQHACSNVPKLAHHPPHFTILTLQQKTTQDTQLLVSHTCRWLAAAGPAHSTPMR